MLRLSSMATCVRVAICSCAHARWPLCACFCAPSGGVSGGRAFCCRTRPLHTPRRHMQAHRRAQGLCVQPRGCARHRPRSRRRLPALLRDVARGGLGSERRARGLCRTRTVPARSAGEVCLRDVPAHKRVPDRAWQAWQGGAAQGAGTSRSKELARCAKRPLQRAAAHETCSQCR